MAIDDADKRGSLMGMAMPYLPFFPRPGTPFPYTFPIDFSTIHDMNAGDRAQMIHLYRGIALVSPTVGAKPTRHYWQGGLLSGPRRWGRGWYG